MSFRYPWALVLLELLPLALLIWIWMRRSGGVPLPLDHTSLVGRRWSGLGIRLSESLLPALVAVVIAMLCGPVVLSEPKTRRKLTNIEFCVDVSGSMMAPFGDGDRYDASMAAIDRFLELRAGDAFGLTFFGNSVLHWVPLTSDPSAIRCAPPFMKPELAPPWMGGTEIGKALKACREVLIRREGGDRMIVLVSDGASFDLENGQDEEVAKRMRADGIVVHAIHIGGGEIPGTIVNVTRLTGGEVFQPEDTAGLESVFAKIDAMQQTELEKVAAETHDAFAPFAWIAIGLLSSMAVAGLGWRFTPW